MPDHSVLTAAQRDVLEELLEHGRPCTVVELSGLLESHPNTVRTHLAALESKDLVRKRRAPAVGRGQPSWLYYPATAVEHGPTQLAVALAEEVARVAPDPDRAARDIGRRLGTDSAATPEELERLLTRYGFDAVEVPDAEHGEDLVYELRGCPHLAAARDRPEIICGIHEGMVAEWLRRGGELADRTAQILPFVAPGSCGLRLHRGGATGEPPARDPGAADEPERPGRIVPGEYRDEPPAPSTPQ